MRPHNIATNPGGPCSATSGPWFDEIFPALNSSIQDTGDVKVISDAAKLNSIDWKSIASDVSKGSSIIGSEGISSLDIAQGSLGNCWSLAAFQSVATHPDRLQ